MSPLVLAPATLAAFYIYVYLRVVIHVRRYHAQRLYLPFEPRSPESLPPDVRQKFTGTLPVLEALGFTVAGYVHHAGMPQNKAARIDLYAALLRNDESGDMCMVAMIFSQFKQASGKLGYVNFYTELADGRSVATVNAAQVPAFKPDGRRPVFRFPEVGDPRLLYRAHRALLGRRAPGQRGLLPTPGLELPFLCEAESRSLRHQVECGYHYLDGARGLCVPTWKGALLMTGKQMWGVKRLLLALMRRRARLTLSSLGLSHG
ncbi:MAG: hypothetical protein JOZ96_25165 [Acidobacteria bacterium]|nr:hypothetical protein [Acidobacteriota bacterium]